MVALAHPGYHPSMIRGGIGCIGSADLVHDMSKYMANAGNTRYWAIEMGTNDAWGGGSDASAYKTNMQSVITACKAAGITPIIARMIATNPTVVGWQVNTAFLTAIDNLTASYNLPAGPDLFTFFLNHPTYLTDGVHPNATGDSCIQKLWADAVSSLYAATDVSPATGTIPSIAAPSLFKALVSGDRLIISARAAGTISVFSVSGVLIARSNIGADNSIELPAGAGTDIVKFTSDNGEHAEQRILR
jgi:hypothetical protein